MTNALEVEFIGDKTAVVRCREYRGTWEVLDFVQGQREGDWIFPVEWHTETERMVKITPNPHKNEDGDWVWLLKKM